MVQRSRGRNRFGNHSEGYGKGGIKGNGERAVGGNGGRGSRFAILVGKEKGKAVNEESDKEVGKREADRFKGSTSRTGWDRKEVNGPNSGLALMGSYNGQKEKEGGVTAGSSGLEDLTGLNFEMGSEGEGRGAQLRKTLEKRGGEARTLTNPLFAASGSSRKDPTKRATDLGAEENLIDVRIANGGRELFQRDKDREDSEPPGSSVFGAQGDRSEAEGFRFGAGMEVESGSDEDSESEEEDDEDDEDMSRDEGTDAYPGWDTTAEGMDTVGLDEEEC